MKFEQHITVDSEQTTAVDCLSAHTELSKQKLKDVMQKGCVWQTEGTKTQRIRRAKKLVKPGNTLHIYYDDKVLSSVPPEPKLIADEGDYSVWNKPCGLLSQGSKWGDHCTITRWAEQHLKPQRPAFAVHRLDRAANGLIMIAHSKSAATKLSHLFASRNLTKIYQATVVGLWNKNEAVTLDTPIDDKHAISHVQCLKTDHKKQTSLLQVTIETGRKHQIRKHLSEAGFAIIGDRLYGNLEIDNTDLQLSAVQLKFTCPITGQVKSYQLNTCV